MAVDTREKVIPKNSARGFQKARFWTLESETGGTKMMIPSDDTFGMPGLTIETILLRYFSEGGVTLPEFSHIGVREVWLNVQREFRPGKRIFLRCFQNR